MSEYVTKKPISILPRDVEVFTFIEAYVRMHGFAPNLDEIALKFHTSKQSIHRTIGRLEAMGCLTRKEGAHRNIVLIKSPIHSTI